ncbi:hypothetical protein [Embleya scabrispora]|uniref:hypothetical protein n=1 Tax=Embleya scabrispora TaxID=159449 RepID=UPI00131A0F7A|nr:hypothetical protein [Embleya scabrispora]MYS87902.1 hypothetical protein [Streptomyces sp. SID5474]
MTKALAAWRCRRSRRSVAANADPFGEVDAEPVGDRKKLPDPIDLSAPDLCRLRFLASVVGSGGMRIRVDVA